MTTFNSLYFIIHSLSNGPQVGFEPLIFKIRLTYHLSYQALVGWLQIVKFSKFFFSTDPCKDFAECGANAVCQAVSHAPTCSCPAGLRELNSPYEACVPEGMNLSELECLRNSDCQTGFECKNWQCKQVSDNL